jgi:RHS repeat-associated protein
VYDQTDINLFTAAFTSAPAGGFYHAALKYDERNQLIGFEARRGGTLLKKVSFRYDAFNRRVASFADTDGDASDDVVTYSVYGGQAAWQLLGEFDGAGDTASLLRSYVYGNYIDEVVSMRDHASDDDYFYHQDDLFSVYALTDGDGVVVERYDYGDYGQVSIMAGDGTPRAESQYDNRHAFTGRLLVPGLTLDDGSQILEYRHRYLHTATGRFVQRDPLGYVDGMNLYQFVQTAPLTLTDPYGLIPPYDYNPYGIPPNTKPFCPVYPEWTNPYFNPPSPDFELDLSDIPGRERRFRESDGVDAARRQANYRAQNLLDGLNVGCPDNPTATASTSFTVRTNNTYDPLLFPLGRGRLTVTVTCTVSLTCDGCVETGRSADCTTSFNYADAFKDPFDIGFEPGTPYPIKDRWDEPSAPQKYVPRKPRSPISPAPTWRGPFQ